MKGLTLLCLVAVVADLCVAQDDDTALPPVSVGSPPVQTDNSGTDALTSLAPAPAPGSSSVCSSYNFDDPDDVAYVVTFIREALKPETQQSCFQSLLTACDTRLSDTGRPVAFANWLDNLEFYLDYLTNTTDSESFDYDYDDALVSPGCYDIYSASDFITSFTGSIGGDGAELCSVPNATAALPTVMDYRTRGQVGPVLLQAGGTCYSHAAANLLQSAILQYSLADEDGNVGSFTNTTVLSPQALLDCAPAPDATGIPFTDTPCNGGLQSFTALALKNYSLAILERYPYFNGSDVATPGEENNVCQFAKPQCSALEGNQTGLYRFPDSLNVTQCSLSESQLLQQIATQGPVMLFVAVGGATGSWVPYTDAANTILKPIKEKIATNPGNEGFCDNELNHAVLAVGYNLTDPNNAYLIFKNSWGTDSGDKGYFYYALSNPNSPEFTDPSFNSTCGMTNGVSVYSFE